MAAFFLFSPMPQRPSSAFRASDKLVSRPRTSTGGAIRNAYSNSQTTNRSSNNRFTPALYRKSDIGNEFQQNADSDSQIMRLTRPYSANDGIQSPMEIETLEMLRRLQDASVSSKQSSLAPIETGYLDTLTIEMVSASLTSATISDCASPSYMDPRNEDDEAHSELMDIFNAAPASPLCEVPRFVFNDYSNGMPNASHLDTPRTSGSGQKMLHKLSLNVATPRTLMMDAPMASPISRTSTKNPLSLNFSPAQSANEMSTYGSTRSSPELVYTKKSKGKGLSVNAASARTLLMEPRGPVSAHPDSNNAGKSFNLPEQVDGRMSESEEIADIVADILPKSKGRHSRNRSLSVGNQQLERYSFPSSQ